MCLENRLGTRPQGFESLSLRHKPLKKPVFSRVFPFFCLSLIQGVLKISKTKCEDHRKSVVFFSIGCFRNFSQKSLILHGFLKKRGKIFLEISRKILVCANLRSSVNALVGSKNRHINAKKMTAQQTFFGSAVPFFSC